MARKEIIIVPCYQSLKDPICEGVWLQYLLKLTETEDFNFVLITLEQDTYRLTPSQRKKTKRHLLNRNIDWRPIRFRTGGTFILLKKAVMFLSASWIPLTLGFNSKIKTILGFASLSGSIASIWASLLRKKLIICNFEPHSLYQVDFKIWKKNSLSFKLLNRMEKYQVRQANALIVTTKYTKKLVEEWGARCEANIMPVSVDDSKFYFKKEARKRIRHVFGIDNDQTVILYLGKFDGIYYPAQEVIQFYSYLQIQYSNYHLMVITPNEIDEIKTLLNKHHIQQSNFTLLSSVPYDEINDYISSADIGMLAVPSLPSQKYRSPIKTANYLICGLPYLVNAGVAEDDSIALEYNVGVVLDDLSETEASKAHDQMQKLISGNSDELQDRCRKVGIDLRKLTNTTSLLATLINQVSK